MPVIPEEGILYIMRFMGKIMRKILILSCLIFLFCSCQSSLDLYNIDFPDDSTIVNTAFWIDGTNDPLGLSSAVANELSSYGLKAYAVSERDMIGIFASSSGSAFAISSDLLVTNSHVIGSSETVKVMVDGNEVEAKVIHNEPDVDIAVIKVPVELPYSFKLSNEMQKGEHVTVIGYPYTEIMGQECKVTDGIVSSETGAFDTVFSFQFSAPMQPGNSGGPVFNDDYGVIGIATEKISDIYAFAEDGFVPQNANYAIKSDVLQFVTDNLGVDADHTSVVDSLEKAEKATFMIKSEEQEDLIDIYNDILIEISYTYDFNLADTYFAGMSYFVNPIIFTLYTMDGTKIGKIEESSYGGLSYISETAYETARYVASHIFYTFANVAMPCTNTGEKVKLRASL